VPSLKGLGSYLHSYPGLTPGANTNSALRGSFYAGSMSYPLEPKFVCRPCLKASLGALYQFPPTRLWGLFAGPHVLGREEAPGWLSVRHRTTEFHQTTSCRLLETLDLERNSADAIAPAMTSSVLLHHRSAVEPWSKAPRKPCGEELPCVRSRISQPYHGPGGESVQLGPLASRRDHLCRVGFRGRRPFQTTPFGRPRNYHVETNSTPISCGCQEENINILYFTSIRD